MQSLSSETSGVNPGSSSDDLPRQPVVVIEAQSRWAVLNVVELWHYRELFYFLMWRDVKVRYKQTLLGILWAVLQPLITMLVFAYFFGKLARVPAEGIPYPIFYYAGIVLWTFFANSVTNAASSLLGNTNLITKVYFPRIIIPVATVGAGLFDFGIAAALLLALILFYHIPASVSWLLLLPLLLVITLFSFAVGVLLSALNVRYRDIRYALPFLMNIWMFVSPIIYPSSLVPAEWRWLQALNPITGIVEAFRAALFDRPIAWGPVAYSTGFSLILLAAASVIFQRMEQYFAEDI